MDVLRKIVLRLRRGLRLGWGLWGWGWLWGGVLLLLLLVVSDSGGLLYCVLILLDDLCVQQVLHVLNLLSSLSNLFLADPDALLLSLLITLLPS